MLGIIIDDNELQFMKHESGSDVILESSMWTSLKNLQPLKLEAESVFNDDVKTKLWSWLQLRNDISPMDEIVFGRLTNVALLQSLNAPLLI